MSLLPRKSGVDFTVEAFQIGATVAMPEVRTYWRTHCLRCGWDYPEPDPNRSQAEFVGIMHFENGECLEVPGGEPNARPL